MPTQGKQTTIVSNLPAGNSIIKNEGVQNKAYTDTRGNTTIGVGYKLSGTNKEQATKDLTAVGADPAKVMSGEAELTDNQVKNLFNISHIRATTGAKQVVKNYATLPKPAQEALVELTFNLGKAGLSDFKETIKLIEQNKLKEASKELLDSKWAKQVGVDRATEIANKFLTSEPSSTTAIPKSPLVMAAREDVKIPEIGNNLSLNTPKQPIVAPTPTVAKSTITRPVVTPAAIAKKEVPITKQPIKVIKPTIQNVMQPQEPIEVASLIGNAINEVKQKAIDKVAEVKGKAIDKVGHLADKSLDDWTEIGKRYLVKKGVIEPDIQAQADKIANIPTVKTTTPAPTIKTSKTNKTIVPVVAEPEVPHYYEKLTEKPSSRGGTVVSYINQFDRKKGFNYVATVFANENVKKEEYKDVGHIAHFLYDMDFTTGKINSSTNSETGNFIRKIREGKIKTVKDLDTQYKPNNPGSTVTDPYMTLYEKTKDNKVNVQYKKKSELKDSDLSKLGDVLRQYRYSDFDWDGDKVDAIGFNNTVLAIKTKDGKPTYLIQPTISGKKVSKDFDQYGGGSVIIFIEGTNVAMDFAGSNFQIKEQADKLIKDYKISPDKLIISYHDLGSYSAKPGAINGKINTSQYSEFNTDKGVGAALAMPLQKNTKKQK